MRKAGRWDHKPAGRSRLDALLDKVLGEMLPWAARLPTRSRGAAPCAGKRRPRSFALEQLEPRLLMSADLSYSPLTSVHDFSLKASGNVLNLVETANNSNVLGSATLSSAGDSTVTIERGSSLGAVNGDTLRFDLNTFSALDSFVSGDGGKLSITFDGGDQRLTQDLVTLENQEGGTGTMGFGLSVTSNSQINSSATATIGGDLALQSKATATDFLGEGLLANADTGITLTGAHLTASGNVTLTADSTVSVTTGEADGSNTGNTDTSGPLAGNATIQDLVNKNIGTANETGVSLVTSFDHAKIDIGGGAQLTATTGDIAVLSSVDGSISANTTNSPSPATISVVAGQADPEVLIHDPGTILTASAGKIDATATTNFTTFDVEATAKSNSDTKIDGAVAVTVFDAGANLDISNSAALSAAGAATLTASSTLPVTTKGDASASSTAGAGVAVAVVFGDTTATLDSGTVSGSSVTLQASSTRTLTTTANASGGGSSDSGGDSPSQNTLSNNNAKTSEGSVSIAGAVAVTVDTGTTSAHVNNGTLDAGSGAVVVSATPQDTVATTADASFTDSTTGVAVGVAINVADRDNLAYIEGTTAVTGGSLAVEVLAPDASSFSAAATSGVSSSDTGVAGSLAINVVLINSKAYLADGAALTLSGNPDVTFSAAAEVENTVSAKPSDGGGDGGKVGVGASVAFNYGENTTTAFIGNGATITDNGAKSLTLTADGRQTMTTTAENGATATKSGGTAVTPVIAIAVANDDVSARLGTGSTLEIAGAFTASSSLQDAVQTKATGNTTASDIGVGISIGLSIVNDDSQATTQRALVTGGAAAFLSSAVSGSETTAKASAKGGQDKNENDTEGGKNVDQKTQDQKTFADTTAKADNSNAKGNGSKAGSPSASSSSGPVDVAGAVAVNIANASSIASIPDGITVTATGPVSAESSANADGHAVGDGSASTTSGGTGVGIAVAVNINNITNYGYVGDGATVSGSGLTVGATMADRTIKAPTVDPNIVTTDTATDTTLTKDSIFVGLDAGLKSGDQVKYVNIGLSDVGGLSNGTSYFVHVNDDGTIRFYTDKTAAEAGDDSFIKLTGTGAGDQELLKYVLGVPDPLNPIHFTADGSVRLLKLGDDSLLRTGDAVTYDQNGGSSGIGGLSGNTNYFIIDLSGGIYQLAATREDAFAGKAIALTSDGDGTKQILHDKSHSSIADATSGAGGGDIGVGVSVGVNVVSNDTEAVIGLTPVLDATGSATVTTSGGAVAVKAESDETNLATAKPHGEADGDNAGVGASVGVNVLTNTVTAEITDGTSWSGTFGTLSVEAVSGDSAFTHGENGASGGVGVGIGVAVVVAGDTVSAYVGTGSALSGSGDVSITASHDGEFNTETDAEAAGKSVGVGASVSVAVVTQTISAELARSITTTGGAFTLKSESTVENEAQAVATVKGEDKSDSKAGGKGADGQTDNEVKNNPNTGSKAPTFNSSASSSASSGQSSASGKGGSSGGKSDGSGVGIAAAVAVNVLTSDNTAKITNNADVTAQNAVTIAAEAQYDSSAKGIGAAVAMDANADIAAGVSVNVVNATNKAFVAAGTSDIKSKGDDITIEAKTPGSETDDFVAWGAAAGGGKGQAGIAGSVGINVINKLDTEASTGAGTHLEADGNIEVTATANLDLQTLAAAGAFSKGAAVGVTINVAVLNATTKAFIAGNADAGGDISIDAENHLLPTKIDLPFLSSSGPNVTSVAVAGAAGTGDASVGGSFIVNDFHLDAEASIGANSQINQDDHDSGGITITALNEVEITSIAGALGVTTGTAGVGVGIDVEILNVTTKAYIGADAAVNRADRASGAIDISATSSITMLSVAATLAAASDVGVAFSVSVAVIDTDSGTGTYAYIDDPTAVEADGGITIDAENPFKTTMIAGSVGAGGTAGIGVANTTLVYDGTVEAYIGDGAEITAGGTVSITAHQSEDIVSIAAGVGVAGTVGVAGSAAVNVIDDNTTAYVGRNASVTVTGAGHDLDVGASDDTDVISVAGSLAASGTVAVGVGADVGVFTKHTNAYIDSNVTTDVGGNIQVGAQSSESLISVSAGVGAGQVGVAANAGVHTFNLTTRAFIGDDPSDLTPSAGAGDVHADGSVVLAANDTSDINEIVAVLAAGEVGVGAAAGVNIFKPDTEAFIGAGANVSGDGGGSGLTVDTGAIGISFNSAAPTFSATQPSGVGIETNNASTFSDAASGDRTNLRSQGQVNTPEIGAVQTDNQTPGAGTDDVQSQSLNGRRQTALGTQSGFHGVAIAASNQDEVRTFTFSLAVGAVGVGVSAGVDVVDATTKAYVGDNASVNSSSDPTQGAGAQSVLIGAGNDFYHLAVTGGVAVGAGAVAPAVGVNIIGNDTEAYIGNGATVNALGDIAIAATGKEDVVMIGFGIAAGAVGVGGAVDVLSINNTTKGFIGGSANVLAGGDVFVFADDDTKVLELSGALGAGFVGVGASVGVMLITKDTEATIGASAQVDALATGSGFIENGGGIAGVLDGTISGTPSFNTKTTHGVAVQAQSHEDLLHIVVAAGAGFVGASGSVGVTLISAETDAIIHGNAIINDQHQAFADSDQSVYVNASDDVGVKTFIVGVGAGFVGVSGAVDVGTLNNNTVARVEGSAQVAATADIGVNALSLKDLSGLDISGSAGVVAVGGAVSVWSIGTTIDKTTKDQDGNTVTNGGGSSSATDIGNGNAEDDAGGQSQSALGTVTNSKNAGDMDSKGGGIDNFTDDGTGNANTNQNRINAATSGAITSINTNADTPTAASIQARVNATPTPPGTSAIVEGGASLTAGGAIGVHGNEKDTITIVGGQVAVGLVAAGGAVQILSIADNVTAFADGTLSAGGDIEVKATLDESVHMTALDGSGGLFGLGAAVAVVTDTSLVQASLGNVTKAGDVTAAASDTRDLHEFTGQFAIGAVAAGASFTRVDASGGASTTVDGGAQIGQGADSVGSLTVSSVSNVTVNGETQAISVGIAGLTANFAIDSVTTDSTAAIGSGADVAVSGDVDVTAGSARSLHASVSGFAGGLLGAGLSFTKTSVGGTTSAQLLGSVAKSLAKGATNLHITATSGDNANATAQAVSGGLVSAGVNFSEADVTPTVEAFISSGGNIITASNVVISATANPEGDAETKGVGVGGITLGGSSSQTTVAPTVKAYIDPPTIHAGGDIQVTATAIPKGTGTPTYQIVGANGGDTGALNNTIEVDNHGLLTGDTVVIPNGAVGGVPSNSTDTNGNPIALRNVIVADPSHLQLGAVFDGASVDPTTDIVTFPAAHNLQTGDLVEYEPGASPAVGGLTAGTIYKVLVVDGSHIKLQDPNVTYGLTAFTPPSSGTTLIVGGAGFTDNEAVSYHAPQASTFSSKQADVNANDTKNADDPDLGNITVATLASQDNNNIEFVDSAGQPIAVGFGVGNLVQYNSSGAAIGGLKTGQTYRIVGVGGFNNSAVQLGATDTSTLDFAQNGAGDTISFHSGGDSWVDRGFQAGQTITIGGGGGNNGVTYTIAAGGVTAGTLTLTAKNTVATGTFSSTTVNSSAIALDPGDKTNTALVNVTHSLIKLSDLPMEYSSNGTDFFNADGRQFYVVGSGDTFGLALTSGGPALTLRAPSDATADHFIGPEAVDLTAAASGQQNLVLDLSGSFTAGTVLQGPGGVPLNIISPPSGDGVSSAVSNGSGGGVVSIEINDAEIDDNPTVNAYISSGLATAGGDVAIIGTSITNATAHSQNSSFGLIGAGAPSATANQTVGNTVSLADNTRIVAGGDFSMEALTLNQAEAASDAGTGGLVGVAVSHSHSTINFTTTATVNQGSDILAGDNVVIAAETLDNQNTNAHASGLGFGGDGNASADSTIGAISTKPATKVEIGNAAAIEGRAVVLSASDGDPLLTDNTSPFHNPLLTVIAHSEGYGAGFVAAGTGDSTVGVNTPLDIALDNNASIKGFEGVDFRTSYNNVDTEAFAFSRATGLFGFVDSDVENTTTLDSNVSGSGTGAIVTAGPRVTDDPILLHDGGYDHLAFDINMTNGPVTARHDNPDSRRSLAISDSDDNGHDPSVHPTLDFSSDVVILSGLSPSVTIDADGIITAVNASAHIDGGTIVVDNITNDDPGQVFFAAGDHINGSLGTWEFRDTFDRVSILNFSKHKLQVKGINVVNTTVEPLVDLQHTGSLGLTFAIARTVKPTTIDIESFNADPPAIELNGLIENPIGTTRVVNAHGDIISTASRANAGNDPSQLIRTNILDLETPDGNIGQNPGDAFGQTPTGDHRVNVDVVYSANVPLATDFLTARVSDLDGSIYLGQNQFFTGELVKYTAAGTALGGLVSGDFYYVIAVDQLHVKLASVAAPNTPIAVTPTATLTDQHSLIPAQLFTVESAGSGGFAWLDVKARMRDAGTTVIVDAVDTTGDANLKLWGTVKETDTTGTHEDGVPAGRIDGVDIVYTGHIPPPLSNAEDHYTFFNTPDTTDGGALDTGMFGFEGADATHINSTYVIKALTQDGDRFRPGITSDRNIVVAAAEPTAGDGKIINLDAITEIVGGGTPGSGDTHHVDMLTNGTITEAEKTGDLRVGRIMSTADDVTLLSPARIIDALDDGIGSEADVTGVNITMTAGDNEITGIAAQDQSGVGGIGTPDNFIEINVDALYGSGATLGVLTAHDIATGNTSGAFITEVVRGAESLSLLGTAANVATFGEEIDDLEVGLVETKGDVSLATDPGSIVDARNGGLGGDTANVIGNTIDLYADGGNIGDVTGGNDLEIDSQAYGYGTIGARATGSIYLSEALPTTPAGTFFARDAQVVLLQALGLSLGDGGGAAGGVDLRFTVRESAALGEDLDLLVSGSVLFLENAPETIVHGSSTRRTARSCCGSRTI